MKKKRTRDRGYHEPDPRRKVRLAAYKRALELVEALDWKPDRYDFGPCAQDTEDHVRRYRDDVMARLHKLVYGAKGRRK